VPGTLVISPQAGLGNRLRALSSAIVLARQLGREIRHAWHPVAPNDPRPHVAALQSHGLHSFFVPGATLPGVAPGQHIDLGFSEWRPGDYWFPFQSHAQRRLAARGMQQAHNAADAAAGHADAGTILIETSLCLRLSTALGGCTDDHDFTRARHTAYAALSPRPEYLAWLAALPDVDIGIAIRRGDLLRYSPESQQDLDAVCAWVRRVAQHRRVTVFSDDAEARRLVQDAIPGYTRLPRLEQELARLPIHVSAFLQFLYLAQKCTVVCGTPGSSFAYEAAVFSGKRFVDVLSDIDA
jgi:hypothetical protein